MRQKREAREKLLQAARRREIDMSVLVWRLDRWGRSVTYLLATLQELEHLDVGFVSLTEALDLTTPAGRAMAGDVGHIRGVRKEKSCGSALGQVWHMHGRTGSVSVGLGNRGHTRGRNPQTTSRRHQQIRNRSPAERWPHLRPPHSGDE